MQEIQKIHHISAIVGDPQMTADFYRHVLGLRLIKKTVNFDDPHTYHLYFSTPSDDDGMVMTFFNWPNRYVGRIGSGQIGTIAFRIPKGSRAYWLDVLNARRISVQETQLFHRQTLEFTDRHGLKLALVETDVQKDTPAIIGFHGSVLLSEDITKTAKTLSTLGFSLVEDTTLSQKWQLLGASQHELIVPTHSLPAGRFGVGTVHHIAFYAEDETTQLAWQQNLMNRGFAVTEQKDRDYFKAIYFVEPGGVVFEIATAGPGFTVDEPAETLGSQLKLPNQYEHQRDEIMLHLPKFT
ncbi:MULTISPECIES: VOC family protein [Enterococcus]|uniref:VOC domain-containing protein n=1 Tax=Enterococcus sulfureus ATCC 49903 TaxID=1140003 RepID=S0P6X6_9ENTE|nr:VOC family protein [Enterococcus sulfureus]EOT45306.1 hypothetical protein OMY_02200 [Enterococcus sulfureus ATCC 49903]EOT84241.1 hypothetical protein I573_01142 [Enterococcus sulfureus ATCC 49903]